MLSAIWYIVDIHTAGTYTIIYNAQDSAGNAAIEKTFTVNVYDYNEQMNILKWWV